MHCVRQSLLLYGEKFHLFCRRHEKIVKQARDPPSPPLGSLLSFCLLYPWCRDQDSPRDETFARMHVCGEYYGDFKTRFCSLSSIAFASS